LRCGGVKSSGPLITHGGFCGIKDGVAAADARLGVVIPGKDSTPFGTPIPLLKGA